MPSAKQVKPASPNDLRMIALNYRLLNVIARTPEPEMRTAVEQAASLIALADLLDSALTNTPTAPTGAEE